MRRMTGIVFSDLGQAAKFMALDWVQKALRGALGFDCFPATLNLRPEARGDAQLWRAVRDTPDGGVPLPSLGGHCSARLYRVAISAGKSRSGVMIAGAVLLPEVSGYPNDKIEIVAPVRLKDALGVRDGDSVVLEFIN